MSSLASNLDPCICFMQGPKDIVKELEEYNGISTSDAECATVLLQKIVLEYKVDDLEHKKTLTFCNSTMLVS